MIQNPREDLFLFIDAEKANRLQPCPRQMRIIIELILENVPVSEHRFSELLIVAHVEGRFRTNQLPWHIYRYYRLQLRNTGVLREVADPMYRMKEMMDAESKHDDHSRS